MTLQTELQKLSQAAVNHSQFSLNNINSVNAWLTTQLTSCAATGRLAWSAYVGLEILGRQSSTEDRNQFIQMAKQFTNEHHLTFETSKLYDDTLLIIRWQK